jgi:hypothetical protein
MVTAALRAMGLANEVHFTNYHRLLNRDRWSLWVLSQLLLGLIIRLCLPSRDPLCLVIDETLERRAGRKMRYKSWYHDAVRMTLPSNNVALGIRWQCLAILVPLPWSRELWARRSWSCRRCRPSCVPSWARRTHTPRRNGLA